MSLDVNANKTKNKKVPRNILVSKNTQSELTAKLSDPKLLDALLNSMNSSFSSKNGRVTAVVAKSKVSKATENQAMLGPEPSTRCRHSNNGEE